MSNGCKNILDIKWVWKDLSCEMGVKIFLIPNGCKNKIVVKRVLIYFSRQMGVKMF